MTQWNTVHLIFCEGPHDAAFLNLILKTKLTLTTLKLQISQLPYPISNIFKKAFEARSAEDFRLDLARKFFLPDYLLTKENILVLIFNYGGSNRKNSMEPFLDGFFALKSTTAFSSGNNNPHVPEYKYAIFADADAGGRVKACQDISNDFINVGDTPWLNTNWSPCSVSRAQTQDTDMGPVASYIWSRIGQDTGTLEDIVLSCVSDTDGLNRTFDFIDNRFEWQPQPQATPSQVCSITAKRLKAAFCIEGQRKKPGGSLGVVLDQANLIDEAALDTSQEANDCTLFLRSWLGIQ
ncbi:TPA: hypothetical protein ACSP3G_000240 [Aeromonas hydrophila]